MTVEEEGKKMQVSLEDLGILKGIMEKHGSLVVFTRQQAEQIAELNSLLLAKEAVNNSLQQSLAKKAREEGQTELHLPEEDGNVQESSFSFLGVKAPPPQSRCQSVAPPPPVVPPPYDTTPAPPPAPDCSERKEESGEWRLGKEIPPPPPKRKSFFRRHFSLVSVVVFLGASTIFLFYALQSCERRPFGHPPDYVGEGKPMRARAVKKAPAPKKAKVPAEPGLVEKVTEIGRVHNGKKKKVAEKNWKNSADCISATPEQQVRCLAETVKKVADCKPFEGSLKGKCLGVMADRLL